MSGNFLRGGGQNRILREGAIFEVVFIFEVSLFFRSRVLQSFYQEAISSNGQDTKELDFCPALTKVALDLHVNFCVSVCLSVCLSFRSFFQGV